MKKSIYLKRSIITFALALLTAGSFFAQEIVYVYDSARTRPQDTLNPDVQTTVQILENEGYTVTLFPIKAVGEITLEDQDILNNADLVYIGRALASTNFDEQAEKDLWNGITAPMMTANMWALRSHRMNWFNTEGCDSYNDVPLDSVISVDIVGNDDAFDGFNSPMGYWIGPFNTIGTDDVGNGDLQATVTGSSRPAFVRFAPGVEFYSGSVDQPAGDRIYFGLEADGAVDGDGLQYYNYSDYTDDGMEVFLRVVADITGKVNAIDNKDLQLSSNVYFDQAAQNLVVELEGLKKVEIIDISGRLVYSSTAVENQLNINLDFAKSGMYLARLINNNNQVVTTKFVKQ